jgi:hypothetical protein
MMMTTTTTPKLSTLMIAAGLALGACTDDPATSTAEAPIGEWAFECRPLFPGAFFAGTNTTTADDWEIRLAFSTRADGCAAPSWSFRAHGPHRLGDPVEAPAGATAIDFVVTARYLTLHDDSARSVLAAVGCDTSAFALGEAVNLNATGCGGFAASLDQCGADHDIFQIEGDTLYIGRRPPGGDICAPERRPTELDRDWPFRLQR